MTAPDDGDAEAIAQLVHDLRQPLGTLRFLVDNAQALDLADDAAAIVQAIAEQVDEAVGVARQISRLVE